jgi:hypothetical protein
MDAAKAKAQKLIDENAVSKSLSFSSMFCTIVIRRVWAARRRKVC